MKIVSHIQNFADLPPKTVDDASTHLGEDVLLPCTRHPRVTHCQLGGRAVLPRPQRSRRTVPTCAIPPPFATAASGARFTADFFTAQTFFDDILYAPPVASLTNIYKACASKGVSLKHVDIVLQALAKDEQSPARTYTYKKGDTEYTHHTTVGRILSYDDDKHIRMLVCPAPISGQVMGERLARIKFSGLEPAGIKAVIDVLAAVVARGGYYATGQVVFGSDYTTYPRELGSRWGQMVAINAFAAYERWCRRYAMNVPSETHFVVGEAGAGDGTQAKTFLEYAKSVADMQTDYTVPSWKDFYRRLVYRIAEYAPALCERQTTNLAPFIAEGKVVVTRGDVRDLDAIAKEYPGSDIYFALNEVVDALSFGKFRVLAPGCIGVGLVVPTIPAPMLERLSVPDHEKVRLRKRSEELLRTHQDVFCQAHLSLDPEHQPEQPIYLDRHDLEYIELVDPNTAACDMAVATCVRALEYFVPADIFFPDIADFFRRYPVYDALAAGEEFVVSTEQEKVFATLSQYADRGISFDIIDYGFSASMIIAERYRRSIRRYPKLTQDAFTRHHSMDLTWDVNFTLLKQTAAKHGFVMQGYSNQTSLLNPTARDIALTRVWDYSDGLKSKRNFKRMTLSNQGMATATQMFRDGLAINAMPLPLDDEEFADRNGLYSTSSASDQEYARLFAGIALRSWRDGSTCEDDVVRALQSAKQSINAYGVLSRDAQGLHSYGRVMADLYPRLPTLFAAAQAFESLTHESFAQIFAAWWKPGWSSEPIGYVTDFVKNCLMFYYQNYSQIDSQVGTSTVPSLSPRLRTLFPAHLSGGNASRISSPLPLVGALFRGVS